MLRNLNKFTLQQLIIKETTVQLGTEWKLHC